MTNEGRRIWKASEAADSMDSLLQAASEKPQVIEWQGRLFEVTPASADGDGVRDFLSRGGPFEGDDSLGG